MKFIPKTLAFVIIAFVLILAISFIAPVPVPYYQDFSVMYFTVRGLLKGIPIYDYPVQLEFVKALTPAQFTFHPFPYPPWYALVVIFLGFLPIQVAARTWFFLNIGILCLTVWLVTPRWDPPRRLAACLAAILFFPALGLLVVGQYSLPVLLGTALFIYAARGKSTVGSAASLLLMTFKPHIGVLLFAAGFAWLAFDKSAFARRTLLLVIAGGIVLAGLGFLADPAWPVTYLQSLGRYRDIPGVQTCGLCASLSITLVTLVTGQSSTLAAAWVGIGILALSFLLLLGPFRRILKVPFALISITAVLTLLVDPYLLNYDYVLLLVPLFWLIQHSRLAWLVYFVPWLNIALGRNGNVILAFAALVTFILILIHSIDARPLESYNKITN